MIESEYHSLKRQFDSLKCGEVLLFDTEKYSLAIFKLKKKEETK